MKVWVLIGYSWEAGEWNTYDIFLTKEKAQQYVNDVYCDDYRYDPTDDTYYCTNENFDITRLKIEERTVR